MTAPHDPPPDAGCAGCTLHGRRDFLRGGLGVAAAALGVLGLLPEAARAMTVRFAGGRRVAGDEVSYAIPPADGATVDRENQLILVRFEGRLYAFNLSCPHQRTSLRWLEQEGRFQCPKHKSRYRPDGSFISGRATRGMDRFRLRRTGDRVVVSLSQLIKQDLDNAGWSAAAVMVK